MLNNTKRGKITDIYISILIPIFISKKNKIGIIIKQIKLVVIQEAPSPILSEFIFILQLLQLSFNLIIPLKTLPFLHLGHLFKYLRMLIKLTSPPPINGEEQK